MTDTASRVLKIIASHLDMEPSELSPSSNFFDDLKLDSLQMMELILAFEEEFSVDIQDEQADAINTIGDVIRYVKTSDPAET